LGPQNALEVNEPVLIVRPDDGPIGPKHVAYYVLLMVLIDVLDENIYILYKDSSLDESSNSVYQGQVNNKQPKF
jgi:hypothetical protein